MGRDWRRRFVDSSLRTRVLVFVLAGFFVAAAPAYYAFNLIVESTVVKLGTLFAEKQILFDRYRGLGALMREVSLAETLARSPVIRDWAFDENDPARMRRGIAELEHYREAFADHSYFFVVNASGNYYFNDAANSHAGSQFSYQLDPHDPADQWYYSTIALGQGCHLNVNNDLNLQVTKVWMNCVVREGQNVLGMVGTGVDLTSFIREVVDIPQVGVQSMFVDHSGAVQAHRDPRLVDFHSLTKSIAAKNTVFALLDRPEDREALRAMMDAVTSPEVVVKSSFMDIEGKHMLVGVGYLDRLGWYNISVMDVDAIIDRQLFLPIGLLLAVLMGTAALLAAWLFKRQVLDRLAHVERSVLQVRQGQSRITDIDPGADEIGRLSRAFAEMAGAVGDKREMLEAMVRERTMELEAMAYRDPLTGIANRRGFVLAFDDARQQAASARPGVLVVDLDQFKQVNDTYGHHAGDQVVVEAARRIGALLRPQDACARWGGDEFIMLIAQCDGETLEAVANRVRQAIGDVPFRIDGQYDISVAASVGGTLAAPGDEIDDVVDLADAALYRAKGAGRNQVVLLGPRPGRSGVSRQDKAAASAKR